MSPDVPHRPTTDGPSARVNQIHVGVGASIREARRRRRWSMRALAARAAISHGMVQRVEAGGAASLAVYARLAQALALELQVAVSDPRRPTSMQQDADIVHTAMGELEASWFVRGGRAMGLDEPWQDYHFAGRADLVVWDVERAALLHIEDKTRIPDVQDALGRYNATRVHLGRALWRRLGIPGEPRSETHVLAMLWSSEVLSVVRRQRSTLQATCPDTLDRFEAWVRGEPPTVGRSSSGILLDPFASGRQRRWIDLDTAMDGARPRVAGYADAAGRARRPAPHG